MVAVFGQFALCRQFFLCNNPSLTFLVNSSLLSHLSFLSLSSQDLTQYNTAHNRQISMVGIVEAGDKTSRRKYRPNSVTFSDNEEIINPGILCACVIIILLYCMLDQPVL